MKTIIIGANRAALRANQDVVALEREKEKKKIIAPTGIIRADTTANCCLFLGFFFCSLRLKRNICRVCFFSFFSAGEIEASCSSSDGRRQRRRLAPKKKNGSRELFSMQVASRLQLYCISCIIKSRSPAMHRGTVAPIDSPALTEVDRRAKS